MFKPWKCKDSQKNRCLAKPLLKNSAQTIFQGGTPWVTVILNNVIVSMVPYCAQQLLRWKKTPNLLSTLLWAKLVHLLLKTMSMLKPWKCKVSQRNRCLIKSFLKNSNQTIFQGGTPWVTEILHNVIVWMVPYCAQQLFGRFFDLKGKSIESRFKWIESKLLSIEILSYQ